jgi:hypothetical protein
VLALADAVSCGRIPADFAEDGKVKLAVCTIPAATVTLVVAPLKPAAVTVTSYVPGGNSLKTYIPS